MNNVVYLVNYFDGEDTDTVSVHRTWEGAERAAREQIERQSEITFTQYAEDYWSNDDPDGRFEDLMICEMEVKD